MDNGITPERCNQCDAGLLTLPRSYRYSPKGLPFAVAFLLSAFASQGCVKVPKRIPLPATLVAQATIPGMVDVRYWGDEPPLYLDQWYNATREQLQKDFAGVFGRPHAYLTISGGGADGAFGAGLLNGWTEAGTRPVFTVVTGISTGALIAPFAFLGPEFDDELEKVYTETSTEDILDKRGMLTTLRSDAAASSKPLAELLTHYITEEMRQAIAAEHRSGRRLLVGTTNLDAARPVIWSLGAIANSPGPRSLYLMRQVLLASASIPGAFPPVLIGVEADGRVFDEIHVDGGVTAQVFLSPVGFDWRRIQEKLEIPSEPQIYIIRNAQIEPTWETVTNRFGPIITRSVSALIRTQGIGDLYRIYLQAKRDNLGFNLASIPVDFEQKPKEIFDVEYMKQLFDVGHELAGSSSVWRMRPPGFSEN